MKALKLFLAILFFVPLVLSGQIDSVHTVGGWKIIGHTGSVTKAYSRVVTDTAYSGKHSQSYVIKSVDSSDLSSVTWEKIYSKTFTKTNQGIIYPYLKKLGPSFPNDGWVYVIIYFGDSSGYTNALGALIVPGFVYNVFYPITFGLENSREKFDRIKIRIQLRQTNDVEVFLDCLAFDYGSPMIDDFEDTTVPVEKEPTIPNSFKLFQNYPNPFNPETKIRFELSSTKFVKLQVFDALGREIVVLVNEEKFTGEYEVKFNASNLSSGTYLYRLSVGNYTETKKMILIK